MREPGSSPRWTTGRTPTALLAAAVLIGVACKDDGGVARDAAPPGDGPLDIVSGAETGSSDNARLDRAGGDGPDAGAADGMPEAGTLVQSTQAREVIAAPPAEVTQLTADDRSFAFRLLPALPGGPPAAAPANAFYSPHSISVALAMTHAGARGTTATEIAGALDFKLPAATLHRAFNALDQELSRRSQLPTGATGDAPRLAIVNAIWGRQGTTFVPAYLDLLAVNYGSGLRLVDFSGDPNGSRLTINDWVSSQTAGRIPSLLAAGDVTPATVLVLTNAIHFKASWDQPFQASLTTMRPFQLTPGNMVPVPTMERTGRLRHAGSFDVQVVELPYVGEQLVMTILVPRPGKEATYESALTPAVFDGLVSALAEKQVRLRMPRFSFSARVYLKQTLSAMGMPVAFSPQADFTGMIAAGGVAISDVIHQAFIALDEKGTEAAAATAVVVGPPSIPAVEAEVDLDRPFLFVIRDRPTGAVLFVGRLADPRGQ